MRNIYSLEKAYNEYLKNKKAKQGNLKIGNNIKLSMILEDFIINEKYSPYGKLEKIKIMGIKVNFCLKILYNYIHKEIFIKLTSKDLPYKKTYKKYNKKTKLIRKIGGTSIEERTEIINNREEVVHWEMDTVVSGIVYKACLLVLTERYSRKEIIIKIKSKTSENVIQPIRSLKNKYKNSFNKRFKTITVYKTFCTKRYEYN